VGKFYVPSKGPTDWQAHLARPERHWRAGFSARTLAHCWEEAEGLPDEVARMFEQIGDHPELLVGLAEHKVPLRGSARAESQNDIFALVRAGARTFAVTVEGKVDESFGPPLSQWLENASPGKLERLKFIAEVLGLPLPIPGDVHYQLLHRTASAVIEARRFKADAAVMLVHSFSRQRRWFDAFRRFVELFGGEAETGKLIEIGSPKVPVLVGWAYGDPRFLAA
jgi:Domain of unknown function (DUF6946)